MDPKIEELLLAKAVADNQSGMPEGLARGIGGSLGATAGLLGRGGPVKRMAGGLVGAILGGQLGSTIRQMAIQESPAGALLAKSQAQGGELSDVDKAALQQVLADTYREMGIS